MSNRKIKVAIIGAGEIAKKAHIPAFLNNKQVDLVALVDIKKEKVKNIAKKFCIKKCYSSVNELFEQQDVDAVSICTPPNTHAEVALKAFSYGAHVLCEKPMATTVNDGNVMFEASLKKEKILMVGFHLRFRPNYGRAKSLIKRGLLGHVYIVEGNYLTPNPLLTWGKSEWFFKPEAGGGVLFDVGPHVFDLISYVLDDFPYAVSAHASTFFDSSVEDSCICVLEFPESRTGIGVMSWLSPEGIESLSIHGTAQSLFVSPNLFLRVNATDITEVSLWRRATESLVGMKFPNFPLLPNKKVNANAYQLEINHFITQIMEDKKYSPSAFDGLNVLITCDAAKKSLEMKKRVVFQPLKKI
jgi:UDP-N-acetylglucosamine 3-dehydrogenase